MANQRLLPRIALAVAERWSRSDPTIQPHATALRITGAAAAVVGPGVLSLTRSPEERQTFQTRINQIVREDWPWDVVGAALKEDASSSRGHHRTARPSR